MDCTGGPPGSHICTDCPPESLASDVRDALQKRREKAMDERLLDLLGGDERMSRFSVIIDRRTAQEWMQRSFPGSPPSPDPSIPPTLRMRFVRWRARGAILRAERNSPTAAMERLRHLDWVMDKVVTIRPCKDYRPSVAHQGGYQATGPEQPCTRCWWPRQGHRRSGVA